MLTITTSLLDHFTHTCLFKRRSPVQDVTKLHRRIIAALLPYTMKRTGEPKSSLMSIAPSCKLPCIEMPHRDARVAYMNPNRVKDAKMPRPPRRRSAHNLPCSTAAQPPILCRCLLVLSLVSLAVPSHAQDLATSQASGRALQSVLRVGTEHDDNALRVAEERTADWLTRYFAGVDLALRLPQSQSILTLSLSQGGKIFLNEVDANTLLTQANLSWQRRLTTKRLFYTRLQLDLKDRTENLSLQDYYRAGVMAGLGGVPFSDVLIEGKVGARMFAFKPNPAASSRGFATSLLASKNLPHDLSLISSYSWLQRRFDIPQQQQVFPSSGETLTPEVEEDAIYLEDGARVRQDFYQSATLQLNWQGPVLLNGSYTYSINRSNSYGQDLRRHNLGVGMTALVERVDLLLALRVELQRTRYDDPVLLDANFRIDEDNRNMGTFSMVRPLWKGFELELRSSIYLQEFGGTGDYSRRTIMLAVGHQFGTQNDPINTE